MTVRKNQNPHPKLTQLAVLKLLLDNGQMRTGISTANGFVHGITVNSLVERGWALRPPGIKTTAEITPAGRQILARYTKPDGSFYASHQELVDSTDQAA